MAEIREDEKIIQFTFGLNEPELEDEEKLKFSKKMLRELRDLDEVERAERTEDLEPEAGSKPGFATILGLVTVLVNHKKVKKFLEFLVDRLQDKPMKVRVKVGKKEVNIVVNSRYELAELEKTVSKLFSIMDEDNNV